MKNIKNGSDYKVVKLVWPDELPGLGPVRSDYRNQGFHTLIHMTTGYQPALVNLYAYELRLTSSANAVRNYLFDLAAFYIAIEMQGIDIDARFAQLDPLRKIEISSLCSAMNWNRVSETPEKAAPATIARRLSTIQGYLAWGFNRHLDRLKDNEAYKIVDKKLERMLHWISEYIPRNSEIKESMKSPVALCNEQLAVLRLAISPGMLHNPFRPSMKYAEQYRNAAIVLLLIETGMRPAELCLLETNDIFSEKKSIWVSKWKADSLIAKHNESEAHRQRRKFPRRSIVGHKTRGREILISDMILGILDDYVDHHRPRLLKKFNQKRSPYLFLSTRDGGPMTPSGIRSLTQRISDVFPALGKLTSYTFRHTSVTVSAEVMRQAVSHLPSLAADQKFREAITNKYGWCLSSEMIEHYGRDDLNRLLAELATEQSRSKSTFSNVPIYDAANDA